MTVPSETLRAAYNGAGTTGPFVVPYYFLEDDDLLVIKTLISDGSQTTLALTADYTVTGAGSAAGGSITTLVAVSALYTITIIRDPDRLQGIDFTPNDKFPANTAERGLDKLTMLVQRIRDMVLRSLRQPDGDAANIGVMPAKVNRVSKFLAFDVNGDPIASAGGAIGVPVTAFAATLLDDPDAATARATLGGIPLTTDIEHANLIIGGDFSTNPWQRGVTFAAVADGAYTADRWKYRKVGAMVHTISQSADAPTVAQAGRLLTHCLMLDCTTIDAAIAAGDFCYVEQPIEGRNFLPYAQKPMFVSFWHKHTKVGWYSVSFGNSGQDRVFECNYQQVNSDAWELATFPIDASPSAGTWDYTTGVGLTARFALVAGTNFYNGNPQTWVASNQFSSVLQVNACDTVGNKFRITDVKLHPGSVATPSVPEAIQQVLEKCQRYYWKTFQQGVTPGQNVTTAGAIGYNAPIAGVFTFSIMNRFPVVMRANPTIVTYNPQAANANWRNTGAVADSGVPVINALTLCDNGFRISNPQVAGDAASATLVVQATADAEL